MYTTNSAVDQKSKKAIIPEWDLSDLYKGLSDPAINSDLANVELSARQFATQYQKSFSSINGIEFATAIKSYEKINEDLSKISSFAQLVFAANTEDSNITKFWQDINERIILISALVLFFELEINKIDDEKLFKLMKTTEAIDYKPWIDALRRFKPYQLPDELEKIFHEKTVAGRMAWTRLFDETMSGLRFVIGGKRYNSNEVVSMMSDKNSSRRKEAAKAFGEELSNNIRLFSLITNTLAKDKEIEDRWRNLPHPVSARNLENQVEDQVIDNLRQAVRESYSDISHRYYKLKAGWLGLDYINYWDRNAPLPESSESSIAWERAKNIVIRSYHEFEPLMAQIAKRFFDNRWIDANPRQGKDPGAFSHPTVPMVHPYILMNYNGKPRDVMTLAHELGHGIHQILASNQGYLLAETPLTLAETASVFGEMLTFQSLLRTTDNRSSRKVLLASKVEDMLNTVFRQISFLDFEERVHLERKRGELDSNRLGEIWMSGQRESLGPAFKFDEEYKNYWAYIPHFVHSPFYVYAYAFGDCLVNSLFDLYSQGYPQFKQKYVKLLQAGGSIKYDELLAIFELDVSLPSFWKGGLNVISNLINELEEC